jgi:preprotein translocase subunit SecG
VAEVSNSRKFVAASRVAGRYAGKSRTISAARNALSAIARSFGNVLHRLWHEVMGVFFFVFSLVGVLAVYREYRKYSVQIPHPSVAHLIAAGAFALVFFYFSISSFWRARSREKTQGKK